jgi:signal transduction histidine kinase
VILIVDDDEQVRTLLRRILERHEYQCQEADSGATARAMLRSVAPSLLLCDVAMPDESGLSLLRDVRASHPDVPTVMVSGLNDPYLAGAALDDGAYGYVTKPFDSTQVLIAVANALRRARLEAENREHREALEAKVQARTAALDGALSALRRSDERRRRLLARMVDAQEEERRRIAADVHDDAVQVMTAVNFRLEVLRRGLTDPQQAAAALKLEETVSLSISRLRNLLFELSPPTLMTRGLGDAVRAFLEQQQDWGVTWEVEEDLVTQPPPELRTLLFRIGQEALVNVRKHAGPCLVVVRISDQQGGVLLEVRDTGRGCVPADLEQSEAGHLGISGMRERATLAGGWWKLDSEPAKGARVEAWIPLPAAVAHG